MQPLIVLYNVYVVDMRTEEVFPLERIIGPYSEERAKTMIIAQMVENGLITSDDVGFLWIQVVTIGSYEKPPHIA